VVNQAEARRTFSFPIVLLSARMTKLPPYSMSSGRRNTLKEEIKKT
jgi:hypothetical protein